MRIFEREFLKQIAPAALPLMGVFLLGGCGQGEPVELPPVEVPIPEQVAEAPSFAAINVGGKDYTSSDGIQYSGDAEDVAIGNIGWIEAVAGTPDPALYRSYRYGNFSLNIPLKDGTYDVTLHFAEPDEITESARSFDVLIEGKVAIIHLDLWVENGRKIRSAYARTLPRIEVTDGALNIDFDAHLGDPVLSAVTVIPHTPPDVSAYTLLWTDEFEEDGAPDPARWTYTIWDARKVNNEDQAYTNFPRNVRVEDGNLILEAHKESYRNAEFTSGRISSIGKGDIVHGRVEVRAKLPLGRGTWPAIWMYPTERFTHSDCTEKKASIGKCSPWPDSGEFDIMEHVGNSPGIVHSTIHTKAYYWVNQRQRKGTVQLVDPGKAFHVYALNWGPDRMDVFVDDTLYFTYMRESGAGWQEWPFDHPYHVILNLAVGGWWGRSNGGIDDAAFPQRLEVDYVRFYTLSDATTDTQQVTD